MITLKQVKELVSENVWKGMKELKYSSSEHGTDVVFYKFENSDATPHINLREGEIYCNCLYASTTNSDNTKFCKHKVYVLLEWLEILNDYPKNRNCIPLAFCNTIEDKENARRSIPIRIYPFLAKARHEKYMVSCDEAQSFARFYSNEYAKIVSASDCLPKKKLSLGTLY